MNREKKLTFLSSSENKNVEILMVLLRDKIAKIKREPSFFICSNLARTIKAAQQNNAAREKKNQQQVEFRTVFLFFFFKFSKQGCDRQVCETLARFVIDQALATLVMTEKADIIHWTGK